MKRIYRYDNYGRSKPAPWYVYPLVWLGLIKVC